MEGHKQLKLILLGKRYHLQLKFAAGFSFGKKVDDQEIERI